MRPHGMTDTGGKPFPARNNLQETICRKLFVEGLRAIMAGKETSRR
jgi:hypothetical protein